jgi:transaldolase
MSENPLKMLRKLGQSVWYDYIRRDIYTTDKLERLIREDGLAGMTSNPTIFQKAIAETDLYDDDIRRFAQEGDETTRVFERLAVEDVRRAADVFRGVHAETGGDDGFVSIEVAPKLAHDTDATIAQARSLWKQCDKPNVMVKIPGTREGVPAIRTCLAEGININITLLFSVDRYREVMEAYLSAMEERVKSGRPVEKIRSVASFFVSRVDTNADKKIDAVLKDPAISEERRGRAKELRGKLAVANARLAYLAWEEALGGPRFAALKAKGVRTQRPLWASTSTKDPAYPELYYVEELIAPETVDTMPPETFEAYRQKGEPTVRIHDDLDQARAAFRGLAEVGLDEKQIFRELEDDGVKKFSDSFDELMKALEKKEKAMRVA